MPARTSAAPAVTCVLMSFPVAARALAAWVVDHRLAASFPQHPAPQLLVGAVIVPRPAGEDRLVIRQLCGSDAVMALASATRVQGWRDPQVLRRSLHQWRTVAARVPVVELSAPWHRLAEPGLLEVVAGAMGSEAAW